MKIILILFSFLLIGCSTEKSLVTDSSIIEAHPKPLRIYEIGYWGSSYMILNLVDAKSGHFIIRVHRDDDLVTGAIYQK
ncbi:MAG: hypothetical protein JWP94_3262 [Mucilaginibacter sp.]|nr:hypothetical protein [Mucilaginibacter sp.]